MHGRVLIDTLNRHSIDTSIDTPLISRQSVKSRLIFDWFIWVGRHSNDYQLTVDQTTECRWSIDRDVDQDVSRGYRSRVSINTWLRMPLVHMYDLTFLINLIVLWVLGAARISTGVQGGVGQGFQTKTKNTSHNRSIGILPKNKKFTSALSQKK